MPPQPMPATENTVQGSVTDLLLADAALSGLVGASVFAGDIPGEYPLPFVWVSASDTTRRWITTANRLETTQLRVEVYATGASAAGAENPAEVIARAAERVLGWQDLPIPGSTPIRVEQRSHTLTEERKRSGSKARVWKVTLAWEVELYVHS